MARPRLRTFPVVAGALVAAAVGAAVPVVELFVFRRLGGSPVPGPHELGGTVSGGSGGRSRVRWVWLGDSLSAGVGADDPDETFPRQAAALVGARRHCDVELVCLAVPGASAADVLAEQVPVALAALTGGVTAVVAVGCNDVLQLVRPHAFRAAYTAILEALGATGAGVVAVGLPDLGSMIVVMPQPLRYLAGLAAGHADRIVRDVAVRTGAHYVSIGSGQRRGRRSRQRARTVLSADRFHPNGVGYGIWAGLVALPLLRLADAHATPP